MRSWFPPAAILAVCVALVAVAVRTGASAATLAAIVAAAAAGLVAVVALVRGAQGGSVRPRFGRRRTDPLTGVLDRRSFQAAASRALDEARERGDLLALAIVDLDRFEVLNATFGDAVGDAALARVAEALRANVRDGDLVGRLDGDAFAVALAGLRDVASAEAVAFKLHGLFGAQADVGGADVELTASIGAAVAPTDGRDVATLLAGAAAAVRKVKEAGRDGVAFASAERRARSDRRIEIERRLRIALREDRFELRCLPTFDLRTARPVGAELLLRWRDDELGLVSPAEFVPMAEASGLVLPLGRWVLERACRQLAAWNASGVTASVSVNVSALQFRQQDFVEAVDDALRASGVDPARLELEIGEAALMHDFAQAYRTLMRLEGMGVPVVLDDFGTGASALAHLQDLPLRALKVDRSFVAGLELKDRDAPGGTAPTVRAVIGLARAFGMGVVAEGIETPEQLAWLREAGCDQGQGFLLARPEPPRDATRRLQEAARRPPAMAFADDGLLTQPS